MDKFSDLVGQTLTNIEDGKVGSDNLRFLTSTGAAYRMYHVNECCEAVSVEDICGDLQDLIGSPILHAEETTSEENPQGNDAAYGDSFLWTFYRISTIKGTVVIRWYGTSNGYYGVGVDFTKEDGRKYYA